MWCWCKKVLNTSDGYYLIPCFLWHSVVFLETYKVHLEAAAGAHCAALLHERVNHFLFCQHKAYSYNGYEIRIRESCYTGCIT